MGTKKVLLVTLTVLSFGGPLEAATGGRLVRAAVRLQSAIESRVTDPLLRDKLGTQAKSLTSDLRAVRRAKPSARRAAYTNALERARLIDAALPANVPAPARARLRRAVAALERALIRATHRASENGRVRPLAR